MKNQTNVVIFGILLAFFSVAFSTNVSNRFYSSETKIKKSESDSVQVSGPVFYTGINFKGFKYKIKRFIVIPEQNFEYAVLNKKQNFFETYYEGKPFTEGMSDFVYMNLGYEIAKINEHAYEE
jgi:hypothetical protein